MTMKVTSVLVTSPSWPSRVALECRVPLSHEDGPRRDPPRARVANPPCARPSRLGRRFPGH